MTDLTPEEQRKFSSSCQTMLELAEKKDNFVERASWGEINFHDIEKEIGLAFDIVKHIGKIHVEILPRRIYDRSLSYMDNMSEVFKAIDQFRISDADPQAARDKIVVDFRTEFESAILEIGPYLPILAFDMVSFRSSFDAIEKNLRSATSAASAVHAMSADIASIREYCREALASIESNVATAKDVLAAKDEALKDIQDSVTSAQIAAGKSAVAEFTREFSNEAVSAEKKAKRWLWLAGSFMLLALGFTISPVFEIFHEEPTDTWDRIYYLGGRLIAISVSFYATVWTGRVVLANMHLASVYRHKAVSIQTLQAFLKSTEDENIKDAVVIEAARAIYENVPSGYIGRQATEGGIGSRTVELVRNVGKSSGAGDSG